jgi:hypothetical protein
VEKEAPLDVSSHGFESCPAPEAARRPKLPGERREAFVLAVVVVGAATRDDLSKRSPFCAKRQWAASLRS